MASVKERAAALNLAEKLCLRPPGRGMASKPIQTSIWSSIIASLRTRVKVKRRRLHLRSHHDCFLGSDAVDVVAAHIVQSRFFEGADVSRDRVTRVCQALMDCKVFESVGTKVIGKEKKLDLFQDSRTCLYRFLSTENPSVDDLEKGVLTPGIQSTFSRQEEQVFTYATPVKANQSLETVLENMESVLENMSLSPSKARINSTLPQSLVDEVWQQETVLQLLQLVELPLLDSVLEARQIPSPPRLPQRNPDLIYTSNYMDRQILNAFKDSQEDDWLSAALDCLEFLPDQQVVAVSRELPRCPDVVEGVGQAQTRYVQCKLLLYDTLEKHYGQADRPPLLSSHMSDIYTGVTDLLENAKLDKALEALQLSLKLLHPQRREELRRLLCFMALAADPQEVKLDKEIENRMVVKRAFSRAVIHNKSQSKGRVDLLVLFMLDNQDDIFKIPGSLHKLVSDKLASLVHGKQPDVTGSTFCEQVSTNAYMDYTQMTTNDALQALLKTIHEDPKRSAKEKKRLLGQFYQGHPEVFVQYFGGSVAAVRVLDGK